MTKLPYAAYGFICGAFALNTGLSFGNKWWYYSETNSGGTTTKTNLGLWQYCVKTESGSTTAETCYYHYDDNFPADKKYLGSTQTFQALGITVLFLAGLALFLKLWIPKTRKIGGLMYVAATNAFWAAICLIGSAGAFGHGIGDTTGASTADLHFGWYGALFSGIFALTAAILLMLSIYMGDANPTGCSRTVETKEQPL